jgi:hypothetical protein
MLEDLIQQVSADTALAIGELSVLKANGASEELVLTKKYYILRDMLIERQCTQEMVGNLQYLFDEYESQYVPRIIETGKFSENLLYHAMLNATLYWEPNFHLLAYLINDGNDVVGAVHDIVNHQPHISQYIQNVLTHLFKSVDYNLVTTELKELGIYNGYFTRHLKCKLSNKIPCIPVLYRGQTYDLLNLAKVIKRPDTTANSSPYVYIFDDKILDSQDIQYHHRYFHELKIALARGSSCNFAVDHAISMFYEFTPIISLLAFRGGVFWLISKRNINPNVLDFLLSYPFMITGVLDWDPPPEHHNEVNKYFVSAAKLSAIYALSYLPLSLTMLYADIMYCKPPYPNRFERCGPHRTDEQAQVQLFGWYNTLYSLSSYLSGLAAYTVVSILYAPKVVNIMDGIYREPSLEIYSPVFQKELLSPRQKQRTALTICFNKLITENKAPLQFSTSHRAERNDIIEVILDFACGKCPEFRRHDSHRF